MSTYFVFLLDDAEEIDVCVVDSEVDRDESCSPRDPETLLQLLDDRARFVLEGVQVLDGAGTAVPGQDPGVVSTAQIGGGPVPPTELRNRKVNS